MRKKTLNFEVCEDKVLLSGATSGIISAGASVHVLTAPLVPLGATNASVSIASSSAHAGLSSNHNTIRPIQTNPSVAAPDTIDYGSPGPVGYVTTIGRPSQPVSWLSYIYSSHDT
jgi:hypothetical protein